MPSPVAYPRTPSGPWIQTYRGVPYKIGGRDLSGLDCYGLDYIIKSNEFGIDIPDFAPQLAVESDRLRREGRDDLIGPAHARAGRRIIKAEQSNWQPVRAGVLGATVLMSRQGIPMHVGVALGDGSMIHACQERGEVIVEAIRDLSDVIVGFYIPPGIPVIAQLRGEKL